MVNISVKLPGLSLRTPVVLASGILGSDYSTLRRVAEEVEVGAVTTKSFTYEPREGYATPIIAYSKAGLLNAVGLANPGYKALAELIPRVKEAGVPVIVSLASSKPGEAAAMASYSEEHGADAIELNLSCPHVEKLGIEAGQDPRLVYRLVREVCGAVRIPVAVKLGLSDSMIEVAGKALDGGAKIITAINTVRAMAIDIYSKRPILSNKYGGLSGPAIHPIAVRVVYDIYKEYRVAIIGVGGVMDWEDAIELILAGASAVGVATVIGIKGIGAIQDIVDGIRSYLEREGFRDVGELVGYAHKV
jgi:dihydroorotate dehydrogenase (NAD+) catalytic subunit